MDLSGNLLLQLDETTKGISLKLFSAQQVKMNGYDVTVALYEIDNNNIEAIRKHPLKGVYFTTPTKVYGANTTENKFLLISELNCFLN